MSNILKFPIFNLMPQFLNFFCSEKYRKQIVRRLKVSCHEFLNMFLQMQLVYLVFTVGWWCLKRHFAEAAVSIMVSDTIWQDGRRPMKNATRTTTKLTLCGTFEQRRRARFRQYKHLPSHSGQFLPTPNLSMFIVALLLPSKSCIPLIFLTFTLKPFSSSASFCFSHSLREKCPKYGFFSGPYFPAFGLNMERYFVSVKTCTLRKHVFRSHR